MPLWVNYLPIVTLGAGCDNAVVTAAEDEQRPIR